MHNDSRRCQRNAADEPAPSQHSHTSLPPPIGPTEIRYTLELTTTAIQAYSDVLHVLLTALRAGRLDPAQYARLVEFLHMVLAEGEGGLPAIERECRRLLGEVEL